MATLATSHNQRYIPRHWPQARRVAWRWSAVMWMAMSIGAFVALLTMLSLLPCINHCAQESPASTSASAWFFCDLLLQQSSSQPEPPPPHHHHTAPRGAFEPILVQVGLISATMLLVGRLSTSAHPFALCLTSAPPTPPPRAA
jgi:hypothetical protein